MKNFSLLLVLLLLGSVAETHAQQFAWAKQLAGSGSGNSAAVSAVKADAAGNSYVAGQFTGTVDFDPSPAGTITLTASSTNGTGFIAKYDPLGQCVWAKPLAGTQNTDFCSPFGLALDANHLYITGNFEGTIAFDPSGAVASLTATPRTVFMARYTTDGVYDWANQLNTTFFGRGNRIAVGSGHLYLTGQFYGDIDVDPDPGVVVSLSGNTGNADILVAKYTTAGAYVWAHSLGSINFDTESRSIGVDASGNCYVTGELAGGTSFNPPTNTTVVSTSGFLAKYTSAGTLQWVNGLDVRNPDVATDAAGNSFLTGSFRNTVDFDPSTGVTSLTSAGSSDIFITQYGTTGNLLRAQQIGSSGTDVGVAIALDASGNTYLTGVFSNTVDFDPSVAGTANLSVASGVGFFIAKYNAAGDYVRARRINLATEALSLAADGNQNAYLAGGFLGTANFDPDASPANPGSSLTAVGPFNGFLAKYGECNAIIHVTESGSGVQDGSSWANSYPGTMLQTAINTAASCGGGQVLVARGLYKPTSTTDRTASFSILSGVTVRGGYAADGTPGTRTAFPSSSTLTGVLTGGNRSYHVVQFNEVSVGTTLDGFVITGGNADGSFFPDDLGGGILSLLENAASSPTLSNLVVTENRASQNGGGIFASGEFHSLTATNTLIQSNTAISNGGGIEFNRGSSHLSSLSLIANTAEVGGGIAMGNSHTLTGANVLFQGNTATGTGFGGGLFVSNGIGNLDSVTFTANSSEKGGGIYITEASSSLTMTNSLLQNNTATIGGGLHAFGRNSGSSSRLTSLSVIANQANIGGGIYITDSHTLTATNSFFQNNTATVTGGGIWIGQAQSLLVNSLWQGNMAAVSGGAASVEGANGSLTLVNATLYNNTTPAGTVLATANNGQAKLINAVGWGNGTPANTFTGGGIQASYSLFETGTTSFADGGNNRTATVSPFVDAPNGNLRLNACALAINAGDNSATGLTGITIDLAGNPRVFGGTVDMGAYEFQGASTLSVGITPAPSLTATTGQTVTLTASGATSYSWSSGQSTSAISVTAGGTYSVTGTTSGCSGVSSVTVIVNSRHTLAGFAASPATVCTGSVTTFTATVGNVTGVYDFTLTNGSSTTTGTASSSALSQSWTAAGFGVQNFTLTVSVNGSFTNAVTTLTVGAAISNTAINYWSGCVSTNWQTPGNWSKGTVPIATDDVVVLGTALNQPTLNGAGTANSVELPTNTTLTIGSSGTLTINGFRSIEGINTGFRNNGLVNNSGNLLIPSGASGTQALRNQGTFNNLSGARLVIDRSGDLAFANASGATFVNSGSVSIGATVGGSNGFFNSATAINQAGGYIAIDRTSARAFFNQFNSSFANSGTLIIGGINSGASQGIENQASFVNQTGGLIRIDRLNVTANGIANTIGSFVNSGTINIGSSATLGQQGIANSGSFTNTSGGLITIDRTTNSGLFAGSSFANSGTITIGASGPVGLYSLETNAVTFRNLACGVLNLHEAVSLLSSTTFVNQGLMVVSTTTTHSNSGTLTNQGVISYLLGNPIPDVINEGIIALPLTICGQSPYSPALQLSGSNTLTVGSNWFTDAGQTVSAGSYSPNTFTPNLAGGTAYTLSFPVTDGGNSCGYSVPLSVSVNPTPSLTLTASGNGGLPSNTLTCAQPSLTLTVTSGAVGAPTGYTFSGPGLSQSGTSTTAVVNQPGVYSVTAINASGCTSVVSTTITSNTVAPASANLSATPSATLTCAQTSLILTASASGTSLSYVFAGPTGTLAGSGNTQPVNASGLYLVTITGANGCTTSASTTVFSNTVAPSAGLITSGTITCSVPAVTLTASPTGSGLTYAFTGSGLVSTVGNSATVNVGGTYSVTVLNLANGCFSSTTVSVSSDLGGAPAAPTLSASSSVVCVGTNVRVVASGSGSSPMQWYKDGQPTGQFTATLALGGVQVAQAGSYVLAVPGACSVTSAPFNLTVNPLPNVSLLVPSNASVQGAVITLPAPLAGVNFQVLGGISFERLIVIDRINGFEIRQVDQNTNGIFSINRTGPFRLTVTGANGCQRTVEGEIRTP